MKIFMLKKNPLVYSCNVYLILGDWNKLSDVNTLIDAGANGFIIEEINNASTGVGKKRIEQVIITHEHFDHAGGLKYIKKEFNPNVYSYTKLEYGDNLVKDGTFLQTGDKYSMIIHTPGHSNDSICIYNEEEQVLFSGDTPLFIKTTYGTYTSEYVLALERIAKLKIKSIYPGHEDPIINGADTVLKATLENVRNSKIIN
jgi:glyoxylase-like metal-dependent hydrolase (beta-lactamase superfamily II)